ncbi:cupredoxin domain-containing protein [Microvirga massiliensis]|uniref:cupredoxin domain-containing protein n=1 Tax=Microvirga massiliensis TaxID=1033741 RepID=UPI003CC7EC52
MPPCPTRHRSTLSLGQPRELCLVIAAVAICAGSSASAATRAASQGRTQPVTIVLTEFAFTPQTLRLHHGQAYQLRLVNKGSGDHNLSAPEFFRTAQISSGDASFVSGGKVEVSKGQTRTVRLVPATGQYGMMCTHLLHASFGMTGRIDVD